MTKIGSQLRLHARYSGRESPFQLHEGFEAAAVAASERYHRYVSISDHGVILFFVTSLFLPTVGLLLCYCFTKGASLHAQKYMNDPLTFPTLAALFWIGQTFTMLIILLDFSAIYEDMHTNSMEMLETYQIVIVWFNLFIEMFTLLLTFLVLFWFIHIQLVNKKYWFCCRMFCNFFSRWKCECVDKYCNTVTNDHRERLKLLFKIGFISTFWSVFSHLAYVVGGWISYEDRSIALTLFYLFSIMFLFWSFQHTYQSLIVYRSSKSSNNLSCEEKILKYGYDHGVNYVILFLMSILCLIYAGIIIYMAYIIVHLPVLEPFDVLTNIYTLGQYTLFFAVFLLTYNLARLTREHGMSGGDSIVNKKVLKFWKYLYKKDTETPAHVPDMYSDRDRADSLMAALIYRLMKHDNGKKEQYDDLLLKIMEEGGHDVNCENSSGAGSGSAGAGAGAGSAGGSGAGAGAGSGSGRGSGTGSGAGAGSGSGRGSGTGAGAGSGSGSGGGGASGNGGDASGRNGVYESVHGEGDGKDDGVTGESTVFGNSHTAGIIPICHVFKLSILR